MTANCASPPLVSVLMPAFNAEQLIGESITSILGQTYPHFELLILDDGSSDKTLEVAGSFQDPRIQILRHDQNQGLVSSRNDLVKAAKGKYIAFLDSDDLAEPSRLETQVDFLESGVADICGTDHYTLYQATGKLKKSRQLHSDADIRAMMVVACPLCNPSVMGKAEVFKSHPFESSIDVSEDYALWQTLSLAGYRFANLRKILLTYRVHSSQISQQKLAQTQGANIKQQNHYIESLGISSALRPHPLIWPKRIKIGPLFLWKLNQRIPKISIKANYQIYARFQYRKNGLWTPFTRVERWVAACMGALIGCL